MRIHIPRSKKEMGEIPKKVDKFMPMKVFYRYFQYTVFGVNRVLGVDGTMNTSSASYVMTINIQEWYTNVGYDYLKCIISMTHNKIVAT